MRILLATESYLPYLSGVTVAVDALARGLGSLGHEVLVLAPRPAEHALLPEVGSPGPAPRHAWLPSYQLPAVAPPMYRMPWPLPGATAVREARRFAPDLVHAHSPFVTGQLARSVARARGVPFVFTHHTRFVQYGHYLGPLARPAAGLTDRYLRHWWASCNGVVAPSSDLAGEIRARLGPDAATRVEVIPTGVDVEGVRAIERPDLRSAHGWERDTVVVASLGRLAPEKSPMLVLEALARAAAAEPRLRLVMVGGGPSADALLVRASRPDLAGKVVLTGGLPRPEALRSLRGADLFVFASRTETQGLVLAEALAAGLPAIAVDGPGVRDSVRPGMDGIVVPNGPDPEVVRGLADALVGLAGDAAHRTEMARRAAADADRFAISARLAEIDALYRAVGAASGS